VIEAKAHARMLARRVREPPADPAALAGSLRASFASARLAVGDPQRLECARFGPAFAWSARVRRRGGLVSEQLYFGRLQASVAEVVDAGDLLPEFELAAIAVLEGMERPGEEPAVRRRLRAEGIRPTEHRGALLLDPGELERFAAVGLFVGGDEVFVAGEWNDEFEPFPGRISADAADFRDATPLGLEEWMVHAGCVLVLGDGASLNYATVSRDVHERLAARFKTATR
jgi:hypothetical protein